MHGMQRRGTCRQVRPHCEHESCCGDDGSGQGLRSAAGGCTMRHAGATICLETPVVAQAHASGVGWAVGPRVLILKGHGGGEDRSGSGGKPVLACFLSVSLVSAFDASYDS